MQSVRVGVEVGGRGVMLLVGVGVMLGEAVAVMVWVAGGSAEVSKAWGKVDGCGVTGVVVASANCVGICPQAWIRVINIRKTNILFRTQAVYHNPPRRWSRLSLSEYKLATDPIQVFAGKIAREFY
jgi:hypothetical protein